MNEIQDIFNSEIEIMKNKKDSYLGLLNQGKMLPPPPLFLPRISETKIIENCHDSVHNPNTENDFITNKKNHPMKVEHLE